MTAATVNSQNADRTQTSAEARKIALKKLLVLTIGEVLIGTGLLGCGIVAIIHSTPNKYKQPFFIGGMIVGPLVLLVTYVTICLRRHSAAIGTSAEMTKLQMRKYISWLNVLCFLEIPGSAFGFIMISNSKVLTGCDTCDYDQHRSTNLAMAIVLICLHSLALLSYFVVLHISKVVTLAFGLNTSKVQAQQQPKQARTQQQSQQARTQQQPTEAGGNAASNQNAGMLANTRAHNEEILAVLREQNQLLKQQTSLLQSQIQQQTGATSDIARGTTVFHTTTAGTMENQGTDDNQQLIELRRHNQLLQQQINVLQNQQPPVYPPTGFEETPPPPSYDSVYGIPPKPP